MTSRVLSIIVFSFILIFGCEKDKSPIESDTNSDPHGEEALLDSLKQDEGEGVIKVMTRNVYFGADVDIILEAGDNILLIPGFAKEAYDQLITTDFEERADALALEIEKTLPHLIGLQEMAKIYTQSPSDFLDGNPVQANDLLFDYIDILMTALEARELAYNIAVTLENADVELPMGESLLDLDDIRLVDHDVILVRGDVSISNPVSVTYDSMYIVDEDYGIVIPRGYVGIDAQVRSQEVFFANTHLESINRESLRLGQATQLLADLDEVTLPVIVVGDFNTAAPQNSTYQYVLSQGYTDVWEENPLTYNTTGNTYGHNSSLNNEEPDFFIRIDFVFTKTDEQLIFGNSFVLGDEKRDKTSSGLWPSDHGGLVTILTFPVIAKHAME